MSIHYFLHLAFFFCLFIPSAIVISRPLHINLSRPRSVMTAATTLYSHSSSLMTDTPAIHQAVSATAGLELMKFRPDENFAADMTEAQPSPHWPSFLVVRLFSVVIIQMTDIPDVDSLRIVSF